MKANKIISIVPHNRKTLFLRGIEKIIVNSGWLHPESIGSFRRNESFEIMELLRCFEADVESNSVTESEKKYVLDSLMDRFIDEQCRIHMPFNGR